MTRRIRLGDLDIGGGAPIRVQSMIKRKTEDVEGVLEDIKRLERYGCEVVRIAVPNEDALDAFKRIKEKATVPLVADIHFNYRIALKVLDYADGVRINPGNIGGADRVKEIARKARDLGKCIRIGVNAGSLEKDLVGKMSIPDAMVESASRYVKLLEDMDFFNFKVSLKASSPRETVEANILFSRRFNCPLHIGVTEAGPPVRSAVKSTIAIYELLKRGIGDTIRVSVTGPPEVEVIIAYEILRGLGLRKRGVEIISCPTCGRCEVDVIRMAEKVEDALSHIEEPLKVAVMGCVVNGPGEAKEADVGVAGGRGVGLIFSRGKVIKKVKEKDIIPALLEEVERLIGKPLESSLEPSLEDHP